VSDPVDSTPQVTNGAPVDSSQRQDRSLKPARDSRGRLLPGHTANPGGAPRDVGKVRLEIKRHAGDALKVLLDLMMHSEDERIRLAAARDLLDRAVGKPSQTVEVPQAQTTVGKLLLTLAAQAEGKIDNGSDEGSEDDVIDGETQRGDQ